MDDGRERDGAAGGPTPVAFVGLGSMGSRMARRLVDAGHDVVVWNRTPSKVDDLVAAGAVAAPTPAAAAAGAEVVFTMVTDAAALVAVTEGRDGVFAGMAGGAAALVDLSTVGRAAVLRLAGAAPEGVAVLEAPVLGSIGEAEAGTLQIFVGGDGPAVERWSPLLSVLGTPHHVGPLGAGAAAKLVANSTLFGVLGVVGEAVALGRGLGLPDDVVFEVLDQTPLAAQAKRRRPAVESADQPTRFALSLARKDADLVARAAAEAGVDVRLASAARSWLADAEAAGLGAGDYSAVVRHIADAGG
jgi:3-hydroxyisobutyrate dehydrogenase-like beta-hydroxyacid dehydrogenase